MKILGIESSCDETAAAIIHVDSKKSVTLLSQNLATSLFQHARTGGIIPEIAARMQSQSIIPVIAKTLTDASIPWDNATPPAIDAIAVTYGPGLIGSLLVGVETAKTLSLLWNKPLIPVNHLFGHIYAAWIATDSSYAKPVFPLIALIVSGGHTDLVLMKSHKDILWLGGTRDDAAGEAFDKIGRLLGFDYPAGAKIEEAAKKGDPKAYHFPRPLMGDGLSDFSFSGLKTAVLREVQAIKDTPLPIANIARGTQDAIITVLVRKTLAAAKKYHVASIILGGGVAANKTLKESFLQMIKDEQLPLTLHVPQPSLCTDNAAMIATAGFFHHTKTAWESVNANPELYFD